MNFCVFMGNLVEDPETKTVNGSKGDTSVLKFRIGVNTYISKDKQETTFPMIQAWGATADLIAKHFAKGDLIRVYTRLKTDKFNDKTSGDIRYSDVYVLDKFEFPESTKKKDKQKQGEGDSDSNDSTAPDESTTTEPAPEQETKTKKDKKKTGSETTIPF